MRTFQLSLFDFLTGYDWRPCQIMGPAGFLMGFAFIPGAEGHLFLRPTWDTTLFWEAVALVWFLNLWMLVRGCLNSLQNKLPGIFDEEPFPGNLNAQIHACLPMLAGTAAGWMGVTTDTVWPLLFLLPTEILWVAGWLRILRRSAQTA